MPVVFADRRHFAQALRVTAKAKSTFLHNFDDLYDRGRKPISQSVSAGSPSCARTSEAVHFACLDTGLRLHKQ